MALFRPLLLPLCIKNCWITLTKLIGAALWVKTKTPKTINITRVPQQSECQGSYSLYFITFANFLAAIYIILRLFYLKSLWSDYRSANFMGQNPNFPVKWNPDINALERTSHHSSKFTAYQPCSFRTKFNFSSLEILLIWLSKRWKWNIQTLCVNVSNWNSTD